MNPQNIGNEQTCVYGRVLLGCKPGICVTHTTNTGAFFFPLILATVLSHGGACARQNPSDCTLPMMLCTLLYVEGACRSGYMYPLLARGNPVKLELYDRQSCKAGIILLSGFIRFTGTDGALTDAH